MGSRRTVDRSRPVAPLHPAAERMQGRDQRPTRLPARLRLETTAPLAGDRSLLQKIQTLLMEKAEEGVLQQPHTFSAEMVGIREQHPVATEG
jgi:hypothetical protein